MYKLVERQSSGENPTLLGVDVMCGETRTAGFTGGLSLMITTTCAGFGNNETSRQAFLHGLVLAMTHCAMTGSIPTVVDR